MELMRVSRVPPTADRASLLLTLKGRISKSLRYCRISGKYQPKLADSFKTVRRDSNDDSKTK